MDRIQSFFPYTSLFHFDENSITAYWVLIILVLFTFLTYKITRVSWNIKQQIKRVSKDFKEKPFLESPYLKEAWEDYKLTFTSFRDLEKTEELSYSYFNERSLLESNTNFRLLNAGPSTLVGLGILGTFIGLTLGISGFETNSTEEIKQSINGLLAGMGTAFVTSIWGMLLSIIFTLIERSQINMLHRVVHQLCTKLDRRYKLTKDDERRIEITRQQELLKEFFTFEDENFNKVKPGNVLRDLYEESRKQTQALSAFSTDLALKIEAGFEQLLMQQNQTNIPLLEKLNEGIEALGEKLKDPATEMMQTVIQDLKDALGQMTNDFKNSISGEAKNELENLAKILGSAGNSLNDFPSRLEGMTKNLNGNFEALQEVVSKVAEGTQAQHEDSVARMREQNEETLTMLRKQNEDSVSMMREQIDQMSKALGEQVGGLQKGQEGLIQQQSENITASGSLIEALNGSIVNLNDASEEIQQTLGEFSGLHRNLGMAVVQLKSASENVNGLSDNLFKSQETLQSHTEDFNEKNQEMIREIMKSLSSAKEVSGAYAEKFEIIENGLQGIFEQIQSGLIEYRDTIGLSLEDFLGKYSDSLTKTAESLAEASTKQEDILEELTEQLSRFIPNGQVLK